MATPTIKARTDPGITQIKIKGDRYYGYYRVYRSAPAGTHTFTRGDQKGKINTTPVKVWDGRRFRDYGEAQAALLQFKHEAQAPAPSELSTGEYLYRWLERQKTSAKRDTFTRRAGTIDTYGRHISRVSDIHHIPLAELKRDHLRDLYTSLVNGTAATADGSPIKITPVYVRQINVTVKAALADAVEDDLIAKNPANGVDLPGTVQGTEFKAHLITPLELELLYESAAADPEGTFVSTILATGLRLAECCNLKWTNLHLTGPEPYLYIAGDSDWQPKPGKASTRRVDVGPATTARLLEWQTKHGDSVYVFGHNGTALTAKQAETIWNRVRNSTGKPVSDQITPNSARHTIATNHQDHLVDTSAYLGHTKETAVKFYWEPTGTRPAYIVDSA
jgi:integrase